MTDKCFDLQFYPSVLVFFLYLRIYSFPPLFVTFTDEHVSGGVFSVGVSRLPYSVGNDRILVRQ